MPYTITETRTRRSGITTITVTLTEQPAIPHGAGTFTPDHATLVFNGAGEFVGADVTGTFTRPYNGTTPSRCSVNVLSDLDTAPQFIRDLVAEVGPQLAHWLDTQP